VLDFLKEDLASLFESGVPTIAGLLYPPAASNQAFDKSISKVEVMHVMKRSQFASLGGLFVALLCAPVWASVTAQPGTVNYVEGDVSIGGKSLNDKSIGSAILAPGQSVSTNNGKVEILLTPGIFFRLADNSSAKMISPGLTTTVLALDRGRALVEVDEIHPENNVRINEQGGSTQLLKLGLYEFDADRRQVWVFDGLASVQTGDRQTKAKGGREVSLNATGQLESQKFDKKAYQEDDFYRWASLRSAYIADANVDAARLYAGGGPVYGGGFAPGWFGTGWYWDPYFDAYTFIPGDGIFFSPFGFGYYSPWYVGGLPFYGYGGIHRHFWPGYRPLYAAGSRSFGSSGHAFHVGGGSVGAASGFSRGGGFRSGAAGGFHGGTAGGFHGGGGGGFHGGGGHR
jgi:hypothetical protein